MPTIIRPNRPTKPVTSNSSSTHLQALEKKINSNSNCELLSDLIDIKCPTIDNSPPEPTIPPPAPPTFYLDEPESSRDTVIDQRSQPCAEALFDYSSSHPGDLNFKVKTLELIEPFHFSKLIATWCNLTGRRPDSGWISSQRRVASWICRL